MEDADETLSTMSGGETDIQDDHADLALDGTNYNCFSLGLMRAVDVDHFHRMRGISEAEGREAFIHEQPKDSERQRDNPFVFLNTRESHDEEGEFMVEEALKRGKATLGAHRHRPHLSLSTAMSESDPHDGSVETKPVTSLETSLGSMARIPISHKTYTRPEALFSARIQHGAGISGDSGRNDNKAVKDDLQNSKVSPDNSLVTRSARFVSPSQDRSIPGNRNDGSRNGSPAYVIDESKEGIDSTGDELRSPHVTAISEENSFHAPATFEIATPTSSGDRPFTPFQHRNTHSQSLSSEVVPRPDYSPTALTSMTFVDLQRQQFGHDPRAQPYSFPTNSENTDTPSTLDGKMTFLLSRSMSERNLFFRSLSAESWEDAGDWIVEHFANIIKALKSCRQQRRRVAREHELELARRHVRIQKKSRAIDQALEEMDNGTDYINRRLRK